MHQNPHYNYCCQTAAATVALFHDIRQEKPPTAEMIRLRRRKNEIVRRALFDELRRAFLPPIDRDDLFRLCADISRILICAEDMTLEWQLQGMPPADTLWTAVSSVCEQLEKAIHAFTKLRKNEDAIEEIARLQQQAVTVPLPVFHSHPAARLYDRAAAVITSCYEIADSLLLAILRNE